MEAEVQAVEQAVYQLYHNPDPAMKASAEEWLRTTAATEASWEATWALLQEDRAFETRYYAAILLATKIQRTWKSLDESSKRALAEQLIDLAANLFSASRSLFIRCCNTLCSLILKAVPEHLPQFETTIYERFMELEKTIGPSQGTLAYLILFKILGEEYTTRFLSTARRRYVDVEMQRAKQQVMEVCWTALNQYDNEEVAAAGLECATSWTFCFPNWDLSLKIAQKAFEYLQYPQLTAAAVELILEVTHLDPAYKSPSIVLEIATLVSNSQSAFAQALENGEEDVVRALTRLATVFGQRHMFRIANDRAVLQAYVEYMLAITSIPGQVPRDETTSHETFTFWNDFIDYIVDTEPQQHQALVQQYEATLLRFMEAVIIKASHPPATEPPLAQDEVTDLRAYRADMGDVISYLCTMLKNDCLLYQHQLLEAAIADESLERAESTVFFFGCAAEMMEGHVQAPNSFINTLASFQPGYYELDKTCMLALGNCADWLACNASRLPDVFEIIRNRMGEAQLLPLAASSIKAIARGCDVHLADYLDQVLGVALPVIDGDAPAEAKRALAESVCFALRKAPVETVAVVTPQIYEPSFLVMDQCLAAGTEQARVLLGEHLLIINRIVRGLSPENLGELPHPALPLMEGAMQRFTKAVAVFQADVETAQRVCTCISSAVLTLDHAFDVLLPSVVPFLLREYETTRIPSYVSALTDVILLFHDHHDQQQLFQEAVHQCFTVAAACMQNYSQADPESISVFFRLVFKVGRSCPNSMFYSSTTVSELIDCLILALTVNELIVVREAGNALRVMFEKTGHNAILEEVMPTSLARIVSTCVQLLASGCPKMNQTVFIDVLADVNVHFVEAFGQLMLQSLAEESVPIDAMQAELMVQQLQRSRVRKTRFKQTMLTFVKMCAEARSEVIVLD
ncbi:hypothetical protein PTSG_11579 [Salpingoeca rosetta]|uniref:Importin N-terminal domain-containing protein n=1 Tax=Salpingoeca rosetta (strain ATCC 50818 / BSB-021) TaxID=946362 RepID=F2TW87_SALR5|nr:uncharacterized protein PTSG_11579 [Salpingoeca rosetta]EGD72333.1 hypothetical protein PTSG_11579 [Salpingoeca rosetta]|eukprot:XP_004998903.1 hypothetical protein PTSG_11579 [Salpingoeca rosetta]